MPKTTLTIEENNNLNELVRVIGDTWEKGLNYKEMSEEEREEFYKLGEEIMTKEGFSLFYQG